MWNSLSLGQWFRSFKSQYTHKVKTCIKCWKNCLIFPHLQYLRKIEYILRSSTKPLTYIVKKSLFLSQGGLGPKAGKISNLVSIFATFTSRKINWMHVYNVYEAFYNCKIRFYAIHFVITCQYTKIRCSGVLNIKLNTKFGRPIWNSSFWCL